jgi:hypothetical protein
VPTITSSRRRVKPTRTKPRPAAPFAAGILDPAEPRLLQHVHISVNRAVALTEREPTGEGERYQVWTHGPGVLLAVRGFDSLGDAQAYLRHLTTPLRASQGPSTEDRAWWAEHAPGRDSHYAVLPNWDRLAGEALAVDAHSRGLLIPIDVAEGISRGSLIGHRP